MQRIDAGSQSIGYTGRVAHLEDGAHFYWPGSEAAVRFTGTRLTCTVQVNISWGTNSFGLIVDGRLSQIPVTQADNGIDKTLILAENLETDQVHTVRLYKRLDCSYSYVLKGFQVEGTFLPPPEKPARRLEFYGDSVTAGACVECVDYVGRTDPCDNASCYDNSWYSYASIIGRKLGAETHLTAQGGIAVMSGSGYFHYPDGIGMDVSWDRLCYFPEAGAYTKWDFSRFTPHAVVFALGQNDQHNPSTGQNDFSAADPARRAAWKARYAEIIRGVAAHYPAGTPLVLITTLIRHDPAWDEAIGELAEQLRGEGLPAAQFRFTRNGDGTNGHPRIPEQEEMAEELAGELKRLLSWD
ncbi:MAG: electron transporter RnfD [Clostridia bacterium]|nr:electron transporter RnfD [Clostridia bacterium]